MEIKKTIEAWDLDGGMVISNPQKTIELHKVDTVTRLGESVFVLCDSGLEVQFDPCDEVDLY